MRFFCRVWCWLERMREKQSKRRKERGMPLGEISKGDTKRTRKRGRERERKREKLDKNKATYRSFHFHPTSFSFLRGIHIRRHVCAHRIVLDHAQIGLSIERSDKKRDGKTHTHAECERDTERERGWDNMCMFVWIQERERDSRHAAIESPLESHPSFLTYLKSWSCEIVLRRAELFSLYRISFILGIKWHLTGDILKNCLQFRGRYFEGRGVMEVDVLFVMEAGHLEGGKEG